MFLTIKKVGIYHYLYVVENNRDNPSGTPRQRTIAYLGKSERFSREELEQIKELLKTDNVKAINYIIMLKNKNKFRKTNISKVRNKGGKCIVCGFNAVIDLHHLIPVSKGGFFEENNLVCLCPNHHEMLHRGLITPDEILTYLNESKKNPL
jgi:predicted restriction endonuclease